MKIPQTCYVLVHLLKEQFPQKKKWEFDSRSPHQHADEKSGEISGVVFEAECL